MRDRQGLKGWGSTDRSQALGTGVLFGIVMFIVLLITGKDIGMTWDEPIYAEIAERAARWLSLLISGNVTEAFDPTTFGISWGLNNEHPPLTRIVNGIGWALTRDWLAAPLQHRVGAMFLASAGMGVITGIVTYEKGLRVALFAGLALLTMPRLFFHTHLAAMDFPVAIMWMVATLLFYEALKQAKDDGAWRSSLSAALLPGVALGLALLTKINAVLLIPFWLLWLLIYRRGRWYFITYAASLAFALVVLVIGWPWIWKNPVAGLISWVNFFSQHFEIGQWFAGQYYVETPWYLPFVLVLITTPVILLVLTLLGTAQDLQQKGRYRLSAWAGLQWLGMLVILIYYASPMARIHDQERLLLAVFMHLAILSGQGFAALWAWISARWWRSGNQKQGLSVVVQLALAFILLLPGIVSIARLHPYELSYYNSLVGGVTGARARDLETVYFASTYDHFLPELNVLPAGSRIWVMPNSYDVLYYNQLNGRLRDDLVMLRPEGWGSFYDDYGVLSEVGWLGNADYAIIERRQTAYNAERQSHAILLEWTAQNPELAQLQRAGVVLSGLYSQP